MYPRYENPVYATFLGLSAIFIAGGTDLSATSLVEPVAEPMAMYSHSYSVNQSYSNDLENIAEPKYSLKYSEIEQIDIINHFAKKMLDEPVEVDHEILELLQKNYWDLI